MVIKKKAENKPTMTWHYVPPSKEPRPAEGGPWIAETNQIEFVLLDHAVYGCPRERHSLNGRHPVAVSHQEVFGLGHAQHLECWSLQRETTNVNIFFVLKTIITIITLFCFQSNFFLLNIQRESVLISLHVKV